MNLIIPPLINLTSSINGIIFNLCLYFPPLTSLSLPRLFFLTIAGQMLLGIPWPLQPGGGAFVPGTGIVLSEGSPVPPERLRQHRVPPPVRPLLVLLAGEPEVLKQQPVY